MIIAALRQYRRLVIITELRHYRHLVITYALKERNNINELEKNTFTKSLGGGDDIRDGTGSKRYDQIKRAAEN